MVVGKRRTRGRMPSGGNGTAYEISRRIVTVVESLSLAVEHWMAAPVTITRVAAFNFKSVAVCDVPLGPLAVVVGRNGAGKSNFLDVLRFTADALHLSLDRALHERGGFGEVCRRAAVPVEHFGIRLEFLIAGSSGLVCVHHRRTSGRQLRSAARGVPGQLRAKRGGSVLPGGEWPLRCYVAHVSTGDRQRLALSGTCCQRSGVSPGIPSAV